MADNHFVFNRGLPAGFRLGRGHEALESAMALLVNERDTMTQMLDGDGTLAAHFNAHVTAYGFQTTADAKAAYDELGAVLGKLTTDGSVTVVNTAIKQFLAKLRN